MGTCPYVQVGQPVLCGKGQVWNYLFLQSTWQNTSSPDFPHTSLRGVYHQRLSLDIIARQVAQAFAPGRHCEVSRASDRRSNLARPAPRFPGHHRHFPITSSRSVLPPTPPPGRHCEARGDSHRRSNLVQTAVPFSPGGTSIPRDGFAFARHDVGRGHRRGNRQRLVARTLPAPRSRTTSAFSPGTTAIPPQTSLRGAWRQPPPKQSRADGSAVSPAASLHAEQVHPGAWFSPPVLAQKQPLYPFCLLFRHIFCPTP